MVKVAAFLTGLIIVLVARIITAVRAVWAGVEPVATQRVYFANHRSNGDFVLLWTVLPGAMRRLTRPVAGSDYWLKTALKRFISQQVFNAVLIERDRVSRQHDPVQVMVDALDSGASLILFPEGTRNTTDEILLPLKAGLFHLAKARPEVELVPVWIENLNRVMPKGEVIPIPLVCTVAFGTALSLRDGEDKAAFMTRAREALLATASQVEGDTS